MDPELESILEGIRERIRENPGKEIDIVDERVAIRLADSEFWIRLGMSHQEMATFQMHVRRLCMPFTTFHEAMEKALGRPVFIHEFGLSYKALMSELLGKAPAPSLEQIIDMIPESKRVAVVLDEDEKRQQDRAVVVDPGSIEGLEAGHEVSVVESHSETCVVELKGGRRVEVFKDRLMILNDEESSDG